MSRSRASSALLSLLLLFGGCGNDSGVAPTPPPPRPSPYPPPPAPDRIVRLEGRVLDEHDQPVEGARITQPYWPSGTLASTTADDAGRFILDANWPEHWPGISLTVDREGYEGTGMGLAAHEATREVIMKMYRLLTISTGERLLATLSIRTAGACWWEPICRRVRVNAPSGQPVDLEVTSSDGQEHVGLAFGDQQLFWESNFPSRVTVPGGVDVWIAVRQLGRVTLRADSH